jgi:hypothetical protein
VEAEPYREVLRRFGLQLAQGFIDRDVLLRERLVGLEGDVGRPGRPVERTAFDVRVSTQRAADERLAAAVAAEQGVAAGVRVGDVEVELCGAVCEFSCSQGG